jgi:hypothetical protein
MSPRKPCGRAIPARYPQPDTCPYPRAPGKQQCIWHWLMKRPADVQTRAAGNRRERQLGHDNAIYQARVAPEKWPTGERWCSGCQGFVPLFYTTGSRCKACASSATHAQRVEKLYGLEDGQYDALLRYQNGRCYICHRRPGKKRLAVDHDHKTGEVRGLLCASNENGCNRGVVANLEAAADGGLAAARRAVEYLESPPFKRMQDGVAPYVAERAHPAAHDDTPAPF